MAGNPTYQQVHIDIALTNLSTAYTPGAYIAEQVFPVVPVQKISDKYFVYTKADWLRNETTLRAPGARASRADFGISTGSIYVCKDHALAKQVPDEIVENADNPIRPLEDTTRFLTEQISQKKEIDVANIAFGSGWSSSATPSVLWSTSTSTPIDDVETASNNIASNTGRVANVGVIGRGLWRYLRNHPDVVDRIKYTGGNTAPAVVALQAVAALFSLDKVLLGVAVQDSAAEGATSSVGYIWGTHMLVEYVPAGPSLLTPSAGYIFAYKTREVSRFREDQERADVIEAREYYDVNAISADCGYLIKSAV